DFWHASGQHVFVTGNVPVRLQHSSALASAVCGLDIVVLKYHMHHTVATNMLIRKWFEVAIIVAFEPRSVCGTANCSLPHVSFQTKRPHLACARTRSKRHFAVRQTSPDTDDQFVSAVGGNKTCLGTAFCHASQHFSSQVNAHSSLIKLDFIKSIFTVPASK